MFAKIYFQSLFILSLPSHPVRVQAEHFFFFFCDVRVDPNIGGNVACPNVCRSGILAHFPIRHKNSTRASFSKQIFEKDNMRMLGCIVSVAGRGGFSVSGCGDFRSCPTNDKPTTEGAPTNRPPCHLK